MEKKNLGNTLVTSEILLVWIKIEDLCFNGTEESLKSGLKLFKQNSGSIDNASFISLLIYIANIHFLKFKLIADLIKSLPPTNLIYDQTEFSSYLFVRGIFTERNLKYFELSHKQPNEYEIENCTNSIFSFVILSDLESFVYHYSSVSLDDQIFKINGETLSLLDLAAFCCSLNIYKYLIINGSKIEISTIEWSIRGGNINIIENIEHLGFSLDNKSINAVKYHHSELYAYLTSSYQNDLIAPTIFIRCYSTHLFILEMQSKNIYSKSNDFLPTASESNQYFLVKYLIEQGSNIEAESKFGWTSLIWATSNGNLEIIKYLIEHGSDIEAKTNYGSTSLDIASSNGHLDTVKYLVEQGSNIEAKDYDNRTSLICAASIGHLDIVKYLIEQGSNIEAKDIHEWTSLIYAATNGHIDIVKYLIEQGSNIEAKDNTERTSLIWASSNGHLDVVKYLIEQGSNIEAKDYSKCTSLICAASLGHLDVVKYLIEQGSNIEAKDNSKCTSLICAASLGRLDVVKYLIEQGSNIEAKDNSERTSLIWASSNEHLDIVKYLIEQGSSIEAKGNNGWTSSIDAVSKENLDIVGYLND